MTTDTETSVFNDNSSWHQNASRSESLSEEFGTTETLKNSRIQESMERIMDVTPTVDADAEWWGEVEAHWFYKAGQQINRYWFPIIIFFGIPGNILSFLVMSKKSNRKISSCVYMAALAWCDFGVLVIGLITWINQDNSLVKIFSLQVSTDFCVYATYALFICTQTGVLTIVSMTVDRFLAITFPLKSAVLNTTRRAYITILIIFCF